MNRTLMVVILVGLAGKEVAMAELMMSSAAFEAYEPIPREYTCDGADSSPPLRWEGQPARVESYVVICDDPDAPGGTWVHWVIYNIPGSATELPENIAPVDTLVDPTGAEQGVNDFQKVGYGGPCPPRGHGPHRYHFRLYALDTRLQLPPRATKPEVLAQMRGHVLARTELVGTYERR